jgi:uncharacterized RDD family membrane protein YckC
MTDSQQLTSAPLYRRLLAMIYDGLLLIAILFCATMAYMLVIVILNDPSPDLVNAREGDVVTQIEPIPLGWPIIPFLVFVYGGFYSYFWKKTGQTLGMQAWRIKLLSNTGSPPDLKQCALRLIVAAPAIAFFGMGYWVLLFNRSRGTWLDQASNTKVVYLGPKKPA